MLRGFSERKQFKQLLKYVPTVSNAQFVYAIRKTTAGQSVLRILLESYPAFEIYKAYILYTTREYRTHTYSHMSSAKKENILLSFFIRNPNSDRLDDKKDPRKHNRDKFLIGSFDSISSSSFELN